MRRDIYTRKKIYSGGIYHNSTLGLISIIEPNNNIITIADKNLGATDVWNYGDAMTPANTGNVFQWGNNYGFPSTLDTTTPITTSDTPVDASNYGPGNYYSSSTWIAGIVNGYMVWDSSNNGNLRGAETGTNEAMRGPCPENYHIPTENELQSLISLMWKVGITNIQGNLYERYLKIPPSGIRAINTQPANIDNVVLWSSTSGPRYYTSISLNNNTTVQGYDTYFEYRAGGVPIRPFANTPVQPNDTRNRLY